MVKEIKIAILFSGNGSNMEHIIKTLHQKDFNVNDATYHINIVGCICNKEDAYGITRLEKLKIPCIILPHKNFKNREDFDSALKQQLETMQINLVVLAGFMRILSPDFCNAFKIINIHPSLLPKYKGAHAILDSFNSGDLEVGVSVHWVNEELDGGEIILQKSFFREEGENLENFEKKIHNLEYEIYPQAILKAISIF